MRGEAVRFALIGLGLNAVLYVAYLLLTRTLMGSRSAMTITYAIGVLAGFALNRRITFRFEGGGGSALLRYVCAYAFGYGVNLAALSLFVDGLGVPHEIVQGVMIFTLAATLFLLQKLWVFPAGGPPLKTQLAATQP